MAIPYLLLMNCAFLLADFTEADTCPNPYFCHTDEIKYRSFTATKNSYFNSTHVIRSLQITEERQCLRQCTTTPKCQSMNHYQKSNSSEMLCDLIDGNIWSNASQVYKRENSTHFHIKSPCSSNPCQHGGTCLPLYQEGSFKCACTANNNTIWKFGPHCENLTVSEMTANVYYNFDEAAPFKDLKSTSGHTLSKSSAGASKVLRVPDRASPVFFMSLVSGYSLVSSSYGSTCIVYARGCLTGLSVSFWIKVLKKSQDEFHTSLSRCKEKSAMAVESPFASASFTGFFVKFYGCTENAIEVRIRLYSTVYTLTWGTSHDPKLHQKWSHFMFTFKDGIGIILYLDGVEVAKQTSSTGTSPNPSTSNYLKLNSANTGFEMYIDDFAAWYAHLDASDVKSVYKEGLRRN